MSDDTPKVPPKSELSKISGAPKPPPPLRGGYIPPRFRIPPPYSYPDEYPAAARARVTLAQLKAAEGMTETEGILHVMKAFLAGAGELGMAGVWSVDRVQAETGNYLWHLAISHGHRSNDYLTVALQETAEYRNLLREVAEARITAALQSNVPGPQPATAERDSAMLTPGTPKATKKKLARGRPEGRQIDGKKLREFRQKITPFVSQAAFGEKCNPPLSEDTIRRAERGDAVDKRTADILVSVLVDLGYSESIAESIRNRQ
jgi:hypothetical protein